MYVQFVPTGNIQDTAKSLPQIGAIVGPYTIPVIGNNGFGGKLTSGSLAYQIAGDGAAFLNWMDKEEVLARWPMTNAAAVTTGIATIMTALAVPQDTLFLLADGTKQP